MIEDIMQFSTYRWLLTYQLFCEPLEHFINSLVPARTRHHPFSFSSCSKILDHRTCHFLGALPIHVSEHVSLVSNDENYHVLRTQTLDFFVPDIFEVFKTLFIGDVAYHDSCISVTEINTRQSAEFLIACNVPYLQREPLV